MGGHGLVPGEGLGEQAGFDLGKLELTVEDTSSGSC